MRNLIAAALVLLSLSPAQAAYNSLYKGSGYQGQVYDSAMQTGYQGGVTAYWPMGETTGTTLADVVGGHDATVSGGVTLGAASLVTGDSKGSAVFDGATGCAQLSSGASTGVFNFNLNTSFYITFESNWNIPRSGGINSYSVFSHLQPSGNFGGWEFLIQYDGSGNAFPRFGLNDVTTPGQFWFTQGNANVANGVHNIGILYVGGSGAPGIIVFYIDGVQQASSVTAVGAVSNISNTTLVTFGARGNCAAGSNAPITLQKFFMAIGSLPFNPPGEEQYAYSLAQGRAFPRAFRGVPNVIQDDDFGGDIGNAPDRKIAAKMHNAGQIKYVADLSCESILKDVTAVRALMNFDAVSPLPTLAQYTGVDLNTVETAGLATNTSSTFNGADLPGNYGTPLAVARTVLAAQPDQSVVYVIDGPTKCFDDLMNSAANAGGDGLPSGAALIQKKIAAVYIGSGLWPEPSVWPGGPTGEYNFNFNAAYQNSANDVFANYASVVGQWPPILVYGIENNGGFGGGGISGIAAPATGLPSAGACATSGVDPYQYGFNLDASLTQGNPCLRSAWTQSAFYLFTEGLKTNFRPAGIGGSGCVIPSSGTMTCGGATFNTAAGANRWITTSGPVSYIAQNISPSAMQTKLLTTLGW